jgi:hypothetical protein
MAQVGPMELVFLIVLGANVVGLGSALWATMDAALAPDEAWTASGQSKLVWVLVPIGAGVVCGLFAPIAAAIYAWKVRPLVRPRAD